MPCLHVSFRHSQAMLWHTRTARPTWPFSFLEPLNRDFREETANPKDSFRIPECLSNVSQLHCSKLHKLALWTSLFLHFWYNQCWNHFIRVIWEFPFVLEPGTFKGFQNSWKLSVYFFVFVSLPVTYSYNSHICTLEKLEHVINCSQLVKLANSRKRVDPEFNHIAKEGRWGGQWVKGVATKRSEFNPQYPHGGRIFWLSHLHQGTHIHVPILRTNKEKLFYKRKGGGGYAN